MAIKRMADIPVGLLPVYEKVSKADLAEALYDAAAVLNAVGCDAVSATMDEWNDLIKKVRLRRGAADLSHFVDH